MYKSYLATFMNVLITHPSSPLQSLSTAGTPLALASVAAANLSNTADSLSVSRDPLTCYGDKVPMQ